MSGRWQGLLAALDAAPDLPLARCKGRHSEWVDITDPETIAYATVRCNRCPALSPCSEYRSRLKPSQLAVNAVMAAQYNAEKIVKKEGVA